MQPNAAVSPPRAKRRRRIKNNPVLAGPGDPFTYPCDRFLNWLGDGLADPQKRPGTGVCYTSEETILKVIRPLFLDSLQAECTAAKNDRERLLQFHAKLTRLRFLDPACGCGNFLIVAYERLRELELATLQALSKWPKSWQALGNAGVSVDHFAGIEKQEFPVHIARAALRLVERQMNECVFNTVGYHHPSDMRAASVPIHHANALTTNWYTISPPDNFVFVLGNPPFVGKYLRTKEQTADMAKVFHGVKAAGVLDYAAAWYLKAAQYIQGTRAKCAFLSTKSVVQGEQASVLWNELLHRYNVKIHFAHRSFPWYSDEKEHVSTHVVVVGFATHDTSRKLLYDTDDKNPRQVTNINPYLNDLPNIIVRAQRKPLCDVPTMQIPSVARDGGNLILSAAEKQELIQKEPLAKKYIKQYVGGRELIKNEIRYCLWLKDATPGELINLPLVRQRVAKTRAFRLASKRAATRQLADTPAFSDNIRQPTRNYLCVPHVSSHGRAYVPIDFLHQHVIANNSSLVIPGATPYHFGVLSASMHMAWLHFVGGRMGNCYRYSPTLVYNTFVWPQVTDDGKRAIEQAAHAVLQVRAHYPGKTLAHLYNPATMPQPLHQAHVDLDQAVDLAYRPKPFADEHHRVAFLLELYRQHTA